jgi:uncharacterized membrane protein YjgN (DUF898 family)
MPKMISVVILDFGSLHTIFIVFFFIDNIFTYRFTEAWSSCSGIKFVGRRKEWCAIKNINVDSILMIVSVGIIKWLLGSFIKKNALL